MSNPVIPDHQPYKEIEVTLKLAAGSSPDSCITFQTEANSSLVHLDTEPGPTVESADDLPQLRLDTYCRYTRITISAGDGGLFDRTLENPSMAVSDMVYQATVTADGKSIEIDVHNGNRVKDWTSPRAQKAVLASLKTSLRAAGGASSCPFSILLVAPPYRQVGVSFSESADGTGTFAYSKDIDTRTNPPSITTPRDGAVYFTLESAPSGTTFDPDNPFYFTADPGDDCIIDTGAKGFAAILTNLHEERNGKGHCFYIQVRDKDGRIFTSEDPTIVNVTPSDPPEG